MNDKGRAKKKVVRKRKTQEVASKQVEREDIQSSEESIDDFQPTLCFEWVCGQSGYTYNFSGHFESIISTYVRCGGERSEHFLLRSEE